MMLAVFKRMLCGKTEKKSCSEDFSNGRNPDVMRHRTVIARRAATTDRKFNVLTEQFDLKTKSTGTFR